MQRKQVSRVISAVVFCSILGLSQTKDSNIHAQQNVQPDTQATATVEGPALVRAGEDATFSITLDQPPNFAGGRLYLEFWMNDKFVFSIAVGLPPSQRNAEVTMLVPIDAPAGTWILKKLIFSAGHDAHDLVPGNCSF
jgi:hypothetical protein